MVKSALQQEAEIEPDLQDSSRYFLIAQKAPFEEKAQENIRPGRVASQSGTVQFRTDEAAW
jgi:hypothetical protein